LFRRPPFPDLFPYTTLFRSGLPQAVEGGTQPEDVRDADLGQRSHTAQPLGKVHHIALVGGTGHAEFVDSGADADQGILYAVGRLDRQSTRLNSSHVKTSYAV